MIEFVVPFLLLVVALGLLVAEDLLPTGGALGLLAAGCLIFLVYLGFAESLLVGLRNLVLEVVLIPAGFWCWSSLMAKTKLGRVGYLQPPEAHEVEVSAERSDLSRLVGLRGRALTPLRPSGMVDFDGRRLDGVAEEGLIASGSTVQAVRVHSGRLVVRVLADPTSDGTG